MQTTKKYRLLRSINVAEMGEGYYVYDGTATSATVIFIPTQKIPERAYQVIRKLKEANPRFEPWPLEKMKEIFDDPKDRSAVDILLRCGYIEEEEPSPAADGAGVHPGDPTHVPPAPEGESLQDSFRNLIDLFDSTEAKHFFNVPTLFNTPRQIDDAAADVGFVGVPFSSLMQSAGTASAPRFLRGISQTLDVWFNIYKNGFFSDIAVADTAPYVLCKDVILKDYGDLGTNVRTVGDLFAQVRWLVDELIVPNGVKPIFAGGDHAVTFPIVNAFLKHYPELCLIHLDAHHDLFYYDKIAYNHAAPISNLLIYSNLQHVYSFGLRTNYNSRIQNLHRLTADKRIMERVHLYSIGAFKRLLADRDRFVEVLSRVGDETPCYLTIDLDVLSAKEIAHQLSTPGGSGLDWWELFEGVRVIQDRLNIVACDIVEFNLPRKTHDDDSWANLVVLLLLLIDGLARRRSGS